jgi:glucose/arabinose dehydrogenase
MACAPGAVAQNELELELVASKLQRPVGLADPGDGSGRLFVIEQEGTIRAISGGSARNEAFLDISGRVGCCGEKGLLGLAFHPRYETNGFFFVNYTDTSGDTIVSRFSRSAASKDTADHASELILLTVDQPYSNHNGGHIAFGPDGRLYIGTGDGGSGGDPQNNSQNLENLLGKILRLDVDGDAAAVPPDNPFASRADARSEIWAYGLRNPWRFSFDRKTGDLFIGDVGQNAIEEIDFQPAASTGGENYGWRLMEGSSCFNPSSGCDNGRLVKPILEYSHRSGCSVTGGFRYRGPSIPELDGNYVYGDYCTGTIWGAVPDNHGRWSEQVLVESDLNISSFGEDAAGNLYVVDLSGSVYRLAAR